MMLSFQKFSILLAFCLVVISQPFPVTNEIKAALYLQKFGYLEDEVRSRLGELSRGNIMSNALRDFQRFVGLNQTGVLDNQTLAMMTMPRCGVKDRIGHSDQTRKKRYAIEGSKWRRRHLSYRISKYPSSLTNRVKVDEEIRKAFGVWSSIAPLSFTERRRGQVDIDIRFERGPHGDGKPFDGAGGDVIAHAFFPQFGGNAHFDDEEPWIINDENGNDENGVDLFQAAAHEFGHSLGLKHSMDVRAIMFPYYFLSNSTFQISIDDILGIQFLYGQIAGTETSTDEEVLPEPNNDNDAPDVCEDGSIDTSTRTQNGNIYLFKDNFYWRIIGNRIAEGYPRKIQDDWRGLEGNLDASFTWSDGFTFFFKGNSYWKFRNKVMEPGYPKLISQGFRGIPEQIDAAFVWGRNGKTYFFKGNRYWRYDSNRNPPVSSNYPQPIRKWNGLPNNIDAALNYGNGNSYFFKNDVYYRFNDNSFNIHAEGPPYPRLTSVWWFFCSPVPQSTS